MREKTNRYFGALVMMSFVLVVVLTAFSPRVTHAQTVFNGRISYWNSTSGTNNVRSINPDLSNTDAKVVSNIAANPAYSHDGTKMAFIVQTSPGIIYIANADGTNPQPLSIAYNFTDVSWSPDDKSLLIGAQVSGNIQIFKAGVDNSTPVQLTNYGNSVYGSHYSPDGTKIVYNSRSDTDIYIMNADGSNQVNLTNGGGGPLVNSPSFSPDGSKIIYEKIVAGHYAIGVMNSDGSNKVTVTTSADLASFPIYSPDGTKIAYTTGGGDLHIMNLDGTNDAVYAHDVTNNLTWQPLTLGPKASNPNVSVSLSDGKAIIDVPSMFSDPYGAGINKGSVTVTSSPSSGTTSVNSSTGVITYTAATTTASSGFFSHLGSLLFPHASAASTSTSFGYRICSNTNAGLCTNGTVTVSLIGAPNTGSGTFQDGQQSAMWLVLGGSLVLASGLVIVRNRSKLQK